jgi:hypothetical protein
MCFQTSNIVTTTRKSWDGDEIVRPVIKAARYVPMTRKRYDIDIREFLSNASNAVVLEKCRDAMDMLPTSEAQALVRSHKPGAFDLRVRAVCNYLAQTLKYKRRRTAERGPDQWLFPDETLASGGGDCEDHAFLLAAMLIASGVSGYVVRVALGSFRNVRTGRALDHAWVMYKTESGQWIVLDPLLYTQQGHTSSLRPRRQSSKARRAPRDDDHGSADAYEYLPRYVVNDAHLWAIRKQDDETLDEYVKSREGFWQGFDPSFAASVHSSIIDGALGSMSWVNRQYVKAVSLAVDANLATYDSRDHFDNGYIDDGWVLVQARLRTAKLNDFALACHAIGDFYAHSSWGVFGERIQGKLQPYKIGSPKFSSAPNYSAGGPLPLTDAARFSVNERVWKGTRAQAIAAWQGKLVSGRYAQNDDPHQGFFERLTYIPSVLRKRADYKKRTGLPHHSEIAVDGRSKDAGHHLYQNAPSYRAAFQERYEAARAHIAQVYEAWNGRAAHE